MNCIVLHRFYFPLSSTVQSSASYSVSLYASFDEVSIESDVHIYIITVNCVLPLPLVQTHPRLISQLQVQHQALALHDGALAGLRVHDGPFRVVLHDVQIGLFEVPRVNVDVEVVNPWDAAEEFPFEHVKVAIQVDKDGVK